jgi:23S rRNA (pseudouridine1915-N3)-methyltransferase
MRCDNATVVRASPRSSSTTTLACLGIAALMAAEAERLRAAIPKQARVVVLDERGDALTTVALSQRMLQWQSDSQDVALLIGGPDGLDPSLRREANERIRLSDLTLPHAMVRVLLVEQLYRGWSILAKHPYHRE